MERLRILTLNIWNRQGPWEARRRLIIEGLRREAADVVALQEVLRLDPEGPQGGPRLCQAEELAQVLGYRVLYGDAFPIGGGLRLGNALLSRFPAMAERNLPLPNPAGHETRGLLYALYDTPAGPLPVFVTHLDWQLDLSWVRCQQVRFITDRIAEERRAAGQLDLLPPVLAGDLNAEPDSDEIRYLRGLHCLPGEGGGPPRSVCFIDAFGLCGAGPGHTFARDNRYAAREREPDRRLDYIFVGLPDRRLRGEVLAAWRCFTEPEDGVFASDHYGVAADVQVGPREKEQY